MFQQAQNIKHLQSNCALQKCQQTAWLTYWEDSSSNCRSWRLCSLLISSIFVRNSFSDSSCRICIHTSIK